MDAMIAAAKWEFTIVFLDDIMIFSRFLEEHTSHNRRALSLLISTDVSLRLKKGKLFTEKIDYLGRVIRLRRLEIASHMTDAITVLQSPDV